MDKEIRFPVNTEPKTFIDWFYERHFRGAIFEDAPHKLPTKFSTYLYKPLGPHEEDDPISIIMESERKIDNHVYKGTIKLWVITTSKSPARIDVRTCFLEDEFFLPFFRMLVGIGQTFLETEAIIINYINKNFDEYKTANNRFHPPITLRTPYINLFETKNINIGGHVERSIVINGNNNTVINQFK